MAEDRIRVTEWHNGEKEYSPFSDAEMSRRQNDMRKWMSENNVDVALFTSYHCINYYSGWLYCGFGRKYALVLTPAKATTVSAGIDGGQPWRRGYGENLVYTDWRRDNYYHALKHLIPGAKTIGIEFDHVSIDLQRLLKETFPDADFVDVAQASMWMRTVKSDEEIKLIREGAHTADIGGKACVGAVHEGAAEFEVSSAATSAMLREIAKNHSYVELMDTWTWFQSGINTDGAHNPVTNRKVRRGDILSLNTFPMIFGYYTALERTLFFDHAADEALDIWKKNVAVHERGLELIRPGARCCDIASELNEMFREWGLLQYRSFGYGHSFGVLSHYYGREAGVELREDVETELRPNMVVSMEPMVTIPEGRPGAGGYREHDILVVTEEGAENITKFPYGPEHNIIKG
ncbi:MAG: aminopeptidase P family protein [Hyphomicrobiales bacterium]|nr:aminopeptidase P family protein [Hyphomicrobiales bacterium]